MFQLKAKIRKATGKKVKKIRKKGIVPGVLYGPKIENLVLEIDIQDFEKVFQGAGESSLISLDIEGKKFLVLIHQVQKDPLTEKPLHIDFYQPSLKEEVQVTVPIIFEGESPAVKELGGTLVKNISELEVKALPERLPHEIKVDVSKLKNFGDHILVKDLKLQDGVKISRDKEEILAFIAQPEKVEEELVKPVEEKVEEVERVEEKKGEEKEEMIGEKDKK